MSTHAELLAEIETFLDRTGIAPTTFGLRSVGDAKLVADLRKGADVTTRRMDRVRAYMRDYRGNGAKRRSSECARVA